jgi:hypothetical protein
MHLKTQFREPHLLLHSSWGWYGTAQLGRSIPEVFEQAISPRTQKMAPVLRGHITLLVHLGVQHAHTIQLQNN